MAGIITISPGHDASYPWRQIGASPEPSTASEHALTGPGVAYYLSPAEKGGEPPGRWRGSGLPELGFREGQVIDREVFERLYGQFLDPRDPDGQSRLGRRPQQFRRAEEIYAALAALEPEATAERQAELLIEAKTQVRLPVQYFDVTFSVSKSISLLHASALANAAHAETARDELAAASGHAGIVAGVGVVHLLDHLPDTVTETPGTVWSVLARSLGEQGADGRTALAWRWALTGTSPSPVTLTPAPRRPHPGLRHRLPHRRAA